MYCAITHLTKFTYSDPITDSFMKLYMQPHSGQNQRCVQFGITISPDAQPRRHKDHLGNIVHTFDIPGRHKKLAIRTESLVEIKAPDPLPQELPNETWESLGDAIDKPELYDMLLPSQFARPTDLLLALEQELGIPERAAETDPLTVLMEMNTAIYKAFDYIQNITAADSPIDIALEKRLGVCQDFAHVMIALARNLGIPCRYVSGYLFHRRDEDRSAADATHAWVEAWLPDLGWIGFDPTNDLICNEQHIRVAVGRDYADVPPTKGVFTGDASSELEVDVKVSRLDELPAEEQAHAPEITLPVFELMAQEQQQQQ